MQRTETSADLVWSKPESPAPTNKLTEEGSMKKILAIGIVALAIGAMALPASASTQTIDATLGNTLAMTATPSSTVSWALASSGANTTSGGSLTVNSNQPYTATVAADNSRMTEYASGNY